MKYIQIINGFVNLIGGAAEGLPLPQEYLGAHPEVLNLDAGKYDPLPEINDVYDADYDTFIPYAEWIEAYPPEPDLTLTPDEIMGIKSLLKGVGGEGGTYR